ncbi:MAG: DUF5985 family protein [Gemmatimonadaceae bacterium]
MSVFVYALCALTSLACALLLLRGYRQQHAGLLLWSGLAFACFFVNNAMVIVDLRLFPQADLSMLRIIPALAGIALLIYGLVWDSWR